MRFLVLVDKVKNTILRFYRNKIFTYRTGQRAKLIGKIILLNTNLKFGNNITLYPNVMFWGDGIIEIGNNVDIGTGTIIYSSKNGGGVYIGDNTLIAAQSYIIDSDHGMKQDKLIQKQEMSVKSIHIGEDVWIGANVTILKGSIIQDGAIIGAKSLVKGTIERNVIALGIPAKKIKRRE